MFQGSSEEELNSIVAIRFVLLRFVSFCSMFCSCWSTSSRSTIGLPEQDFGCVVMAHNITCQMKTPLSHDGGDAWEGAVQFLVGHVVAS